MLFLLYTQEDVARKNNVASKKNKKFQKKVDIGFMICYITNATEKEARNDL